MYPRPFGPYMLLERLGAGGMSEVDLARRTVEEAGFVRFVVIKRIKTDRSTDPSFVRMFKDEARITAELHHAHIGQVYDFGRQGDEWYLALEYVAGVDVRFLVNALRERQQRVPVKFAMRVVCDVLDALQYAHEKRDALGRPMEIVHRDVNPRNIMVSIDGEVKLIDFGVAKATDRLEKTRTDHIKGKFSYMAPEQISGGATDHRADLYAVGLCLHEFLAGASPYFGLNQMQIMHRMMSGKIPRMPPVPELPYADGLKRVHDKALDPMPERRYQTAAAFREDLEAVARQVGGLPSRESLARFVQSVDPEQVERLRQKLAGYAMLEVSESGEITEPLDDPQLPSVLAPRRTDLDATFADSTSPSITRTGVLAGTIVAASLGSAVLAPTVAVLVAGLLWWVLAGGAPEPTVTPTAVAPAPPPLEQPAEQLAEPAPDPEPPGDAAEEPAPDPRPEPAAAIGPDTPAQPAPAPARVVPEPEPEPAAVEASAPEALPAPEPVATGTLKVTSSEKGLPILLDGEETGFVTPAVIDWPVGRVSVQVGRFSPQTHDVRSKQVTYVLFR